MRGAAKKDAECDSGKTEPAKGREASYHRSANRSGLTGREEKVKLENGWLVQFAALFPTPHHMITTSSDIVQ